MIDESKVNTEFRQSGDSCVLSSYGIVANYFTGRAVTDFFIAYCSHFGLKHDANQKAEQVYSEHFHCESEKRNCKGYELILDLHKNSAEDAFNDCRSTFDARFILDATSEMSSFHETLKQSAAFLNLTYVKGNGYHSVTIFHNGRTLCLRDTALACISPLNPLGILKDGVIYKRRSECLNIRAGEENIENIRNMFEKSGKSYNPNKDYLVRISVDPQA